jgi:hypothetical protein
MFLSIVGLIVITAGAAEANCPCWARGDAVGGIDFEAQEFASPLCSVGPTGAVVVAFRSSDPLGDSWGAQATGACVLVDEANEIETTVEDLSSEQSAECLQILLESQMWLVNCGGLDSDSDGIPDGTDNCTEVENPEQLDTDSDGYGNACDCDFDQNSFCNIADFGIFREDFIATVDRGVGTDMDSNGAVSIADFSLFREGFVAGVPGPSGLVP